MVTNQFIHYLGNHSIKTINNASVSPNSSDLSSVLFGTNYEYKSATKKWIDVGTGTTEESAEDYALATPNAISGDLTCIGQYAETKDAEDIFACSAVFKNNGSSNVVVKEIGLCAGKVSSTQSAYTDCALFFRSVLPSSQRVTIGAGESYTFTLHVKLNPQS